MTAMTDAAEAAERGDWRSALETLLGVWRECPASSLAIAIEAVSARATSGITIDGARWDQLARAGDPVTIGVLAKTVATRDPTETLARLELLLAHGDDPRLATAIIEQLEVPRFGVLDPAAQPLWDRLWALTTSVSDQRVLSRIHETPGIWSRHPDLDVPATIAFAERALVAIHAIVPMRSEQTESERETSTRISTTATTDAARTVVEAPLLATVYAAPDDDAPRIAYGEWLRSIGDPRAEFIDLQMAKTRSPPTREQTVRELELVARHLDEWIAPLGIDRRDVEFERGFVRSCRSARMSSDAAWATVRCNRFVTCETICYLPTVETPYALEELRWYDTRIGAARHKGQKSQAEAIAAFTQIRVLPRLKVLDLDWTDREFWSVDPGNLRWLIGAPCTAQLHELWLPAAPRHLASLIAIVEATSIQRLVTHVGDLPNRHNQIIVERGATGRFDRLVVHSRDGRQVADFIQRWGAGLADDFASLPVDLLVDARLETYGDPTAVRELLERALAPQRRLSSLEVVELPGLSDA